MATKPANRNADLAAVHIAQKKLGLTREDAAALKLAIVGKASAADMTAQQRGRYLAHLSSLQARQGAAQVASPQAARSELHRTAADPHDDRWEKARVMWAALARAGHVRSDTDTALMAYVKRQTSADHWRFLNTMQVNGVIEALKRWCVRVGLETVSTIRRQHD